MEAVVSFSFTTDVCEEGVPQQVILKGESKYGHRGPKIGKIQRKVSTTSIKIVMHVIKLSSSKILQG